MTAHRQAIKLAEPHQTMNGEHPQIKLLMPLILGSLCVDVDAREVGQIEWTSFTSWGF